MLSEFSHIPLSQTKGVTIDNETSAWLVIMCGEVILYM